MIKDNFPVAQRQEQFHNTSYFEVTFEDGSIRDERDLNWSDISREADVEYLNSKRTVFIAIPKIKHIKIVHESLVTELDVPDDCDVYQSIKSNATFIPGGSHTVSTMGRFVGLIKNNRVIEERFLSTVEGQVLGFKE